MPFSNVVHQGISSSSLPFSLLTACHKAINQAEGRIQPRLHRGFLEEIHILGCLPQNIIQLLARLVSLLRDRQV
jgi:hypothetical protein